MTDYAYIRVSTKEQNIDRQIKAIEPYNIAQRNVYCDRQSGKDFERPAYKKLLKKLRPGDLLIIKSIDRLGRNYEEILAQWQYITKDIKADILVLDMSLLDTRQKVENLTSTFVADLVLQILAYVAQTERDFIRQRQAEGIAIAKANGVRFGPKPKDAPDNLDDICSKCIIGELSTRKGAEVLGMSHSTFYRRLIKFQRSKNVSSSRHFGTKVLAENL